MRTRLLLPLLVLAGCATPFSRVKDAKTIDEARAQLGTSKPVIKTYGANAEAWYFENDDCVLFVDGQVRMTKAARDHVTYVRDHKEAPDPQDDLCAPKETRLEPTR